MDYRLENDYNIIFSSGVLHYIPESIRFELISDYQIHTADGGIHVHNVFVRKPFIPLAPENEKNSTVWKSGELAQNFSDWLIHEMSEVIFDCNSSGVPHKHCMDKLIAQKIKTI